MRSTFISLVICAWRMAHGCCGCVAAGCSRRPAVAAALAGWETAEKKAGATTSDRSPGASAVRVLLLPAFSNAMPAGLGIITASLAALLISTDVVPAGPLTPPLFPRRFSADVAASGNFEQIRAVYQDLDGQRMLLAGELTGDVSHGGWRQQSLQTVGPTGADPSTPYASAMTAMSWQSGSAAPPKRCSYELALQCVKRDPNSGGCVEHAPASVTPFFGNPVTILEKKETVDGVMCEKWSNGGSATSPPWTEYWAIWFVADSLSNPDGPTVAKVEVVNPG
jgi:hypothetical protein